MTTTDYLVVGSGLTGAVIARSLADAGREVLIVERRNKAGGNVADELHPSGIRVHTYGPHYFRTDSDELWAFVNRFGAFRRFEAVVKSWVDGRHENWPVAADYIERVVGKRWEPAFRGTPTNFEEASLAMMPRLVYEKFVKGYTEKQWGVPGRTLSPGLARRFEVRAGDDPRLVRHQHQGLPAGGYSAWMKRMIEGIPLRLGSDYLARRAEFCARRLVVFTGPIDEFFGFDLGRLAYCGQQREHVYHPDIEFAQPCGQVNNPDPARGAHLRTLEWKHMMPRLEAAQVRGTVLTRETAMTPTDPDRYEYPFPDDANTWLYQQYRRRADALPNVLVCGRLGEYRHYDMDQAIARARRLADRILRGASVACMKQAPPCCSL